MRLLFVVLAILSSNASTEEINALELLQLLIQNKEVNIDNSGKHGYTIESLKVSEVVILQELASSELPVAPLRNVISSHYIKPSEFTLGNCARYILTWHENGRYPLNVSK
ncbi:hypothetical protein [Microbulbifer discodermiae]|uniref:hypothetical protein n=1 Tax=Microbulbifer sp. 2201CG32-9 TaxID=3232309 RepID=UPI00345BF7B1